MDLDHNILPLEPSFYYTQQAASDYIDYYFTIQADEEIPEYDLCKYKGVDSTKKLFLQDSFECETPGVSPANLYSRDNIDIGEVCD